MILIIDGENYLVSEKISQIKEKFLKKNESSNNFLDIDFKDFNLDRFASDIKTLPFISEKRLIFLKNFILKDLSEKVKDTIYQIIKSKPESSIILIHFADSKEINSTLGKKLLKISNKHWTFKELNGSEIEKWAKKEIKARNSSIKELALEKLITYTENNVSLLAQEIEKLSLFAQKREITEKDVDILVTGNIAVNIFDFLNSLASKNSKKAIKDLNNLLKNGTHPLEVLKMIIWSIRNMIEIKDLEKKNKWDIIKITGYKPFVIEKTLSQTKLFSEKELKNIYQYLLEEEIAIKRGKKEPSLALNILAIKLSSKKEI